MTDTVPDNSKRIAHLIGLIFHPAIVAIGTLLLVLQDLPFEQILVWTALIGGIILIPVFIAIAYFRRQNRHTYQRGTRRPLYIIAWLSVALCFILIQLFEGPQILAICMATLAIWLPLQLAINHSITKISAHTAVASGCFTALVLFGKLGTVLIVAGILLIMLIAWARLMTKNHTMLQIVLGCAVGAGSVLLVFPFLLN